MRFLLLLLTVAAPSFGVVIDSVVPGFTTGNSAFTGVAAIHFTNANNLTSLCTGSLIAADLILTAGHCVAGGSDWEVTFYTPTSNATIAASQSYLHPNYGPRPSPLNNIPEYDVAILRLVASAPVDATIYGIKTDFNGVVPTGYANATWLDIIGFGRYGLPGQTPSLDFYNPVRHWARNTYDFLAISINGVSSPDLPLVMSANFSTAAPYEGLINSGDSGGPMLYGNYILGVASAGNLPNSTVVDGNTWYTTFHANLAEDTTGAWVQSFLVPEPGTMTLAAAGLLVLLVRRRDRRSGHNRP